MLYLVEQELGIAKYDLVFYIVPSATITLLNSEHLGHEGPTDVITFDYADAVSPNSIHGEVFVCLQVAESQAVVYNTSWEEEIVRYMIHGVLHLIGFDDLKPELKKKMKKAENRLVRSLVKLFPPEGIQSRIAMAEHIL